MSVRKGRSSLGQTKNAPVMRWEWRRSGGPAEQVFFEGKYDYLRYTIAPGLSEDYDSITIQQVSGDWYRLEAAQNGDDVTEIHEVDGSNLSQNTLVSLHVKSQFIAAGITEEDYVSVVTKIAREVTKFRGGQQTYAEMASAVATHASGYQVGFDLMDDLATYGDQFLNAQYCYRRTIIVAERIYRISNSTFDNVFDNTHRIFTEAEMRDAEATPSGFKLPPKIIDNTQPAEWLKQPTRSRLVKGERREVIKEYLFADSWSDLKYPSL